MKSKKPLIYLLHGWAVDEHNQAKWQPLIKALAKSGLQAKFLPIPGLSQSLDQVWGLPDYVRWLEKELAGGPAILLGHSFGGQLAIRYAATHPQQVKKLILLDSSGLRDHSWKAQFKRSVFKTAAKLGKQFVRFEKARYLLYKLAREKDYFEASPILRQTMAKVIEDEVGADLGKIACPTLIIWGENDHVTPLWMGAILNSEIKNSQMKIILGARHSPQFTHVAEVGKLVAEWLASNKFIRSLAGSNL